MRQGSSGSPVISSTTGKVIAIHHSGFVESGNRVSSMFSIFSELRQVCNVIISWSYLYVNIDEYEVRYMLRILK